MTFALFFVFSTLESFGILFLGLALFRFRMRPSYLMKMITISMILSVISYFLNVNNLNLIAPLIQGVLAIPLLAYFFRNKLLYTTLIFVSGLLLLVFIQTLLALILYYLGLITLSDLKPFTFKGKLIQFATFLIMLTAGWHIRKVNEGYAFVPEETCTRKKLKYSNQVFILIISASILVTSAGYYQYRSTPASMFLVQIFIVTTISVAAFLFVSLKRDEEELEGGDPLSLDRFPEHTDSIKKRRGELIK